VAALSAKPSSILKHRYFQEVAFLYNRDNIAENYSLSLRLAAATNPDFSVTLRVHLPASISDVSLNGIGQYLRNESNVNIRQHLGNVNIRQHLQVTPGPRSSYTYLAMERAILTFLDHYNLAWHKVLSGMPKFDEASEQEGVAAAGAAGPCSGTRTVQSAPDSGGPASGVGAVHGQPSAAGGGAGEAADKAGAAGGARPDKASVALRKATLLSAEKAAKAILAGGEGLEKHPDLHLLAFQMHAIVTAIVNFGVRDEGLVVFKLVSLLFSSIFRHLSFAPFITVLALRSSSHTHTHSHSITLSLYHSITLSLSHSLTVVADCGGAAAGGCAAQAAPHPSAAHQPRLLRVGCRGLFGKRPRPLAGAGGVDPAAAARPPSHAARAHVHSVVLPGAGGPGGRPPPHRPRPLEAGGRRHARQGFPRVRSTSRARPNPKPSLRRPAL